MTTNRLEILLTANDKATNRVKSAFKQMEGSARSFDSMMGKNVKTTDEMAKKTNLLSQRWVHLTAKVLAAGYAFRIASRAFGSIVNNARRFEAIERQMLAFTGSAQEARKVFLEIKQFGATTPFDIFETFGAAPNLMMLRKYGFELKELLTITGNVASNFGISFSEAAENIQRSMNAGIGSTRLFMQKGVRATLQEAMGDVDILNVSTEKLGDTFKKVFLDESSRFSKGMEEAAKSFEGPMGMFEDSFLQFTAALGEFVTKSPEIAKGLTTLSGALDRATNAMKGLSNQVLAKSGVPMAHRFMFGAGSALAQRLGFKRKSFPIERFMTNGLFGDITQPRDDTYTSVLDRNPGPANMASQEQTEQAVSSFNRIKEAIKNNTAAMKEFNTVGQNTANALSSAYSDVFFNVFTEGTLNAREAFAEFGQSVMRILADMIARVLIFGLAMNAIGAAFGIPPGVLSSMGGMSGFGYIPQTAHSGGKIRKFHGGGEVPALLQSGEFVVNRHDASKNSGLLNSINRGGSGGGQGGVMVINNINLSAIDARSSEEYLRSNKDTISGLITEQIMLNGTIRDVIKKVT